MELLESKMNIPKTRYFEAVLVKLPRWMEEELWEDFEQLVHDLLDHRDHCLHRLRLMSLLCNILDLSETKAS